VDMGWRFRRSIGLGPLRLNMSKSGVGYSWGVPGIRVSTSPNGRRYLWLSIPGTGLSWSKELRNPTAGTKRGPVNRQANKTRVRDAIKRTHLENQVGTTADGRPVIDISSVLND
jgi:hypothetical protein